MSPKSSQEEFEALLQKVFKDTGLDCSRYKENYLKRRISGRMRAVGAASYAEYASFLERSAEEYPKLKDRITVNVTEFFRDQDVYDYLRKDLLPLVARKCQSEGRPLFVWSAGCSSGEEPYSLAILLAEMNAGPWSVLATDIDEACLEKARRGHYDLDALQRAALPDLSRWFTLEGGEAVVSGALKRRVHIQRHNLFADPPPGGMDVVLCRNVMIYFSRELQQRLLEAFYSALRPGGYLLPGKTETILGPVRHRYTSISVRARAFQRL